MHAAASGAYGDGVLQVQHLVIQQVLDGTTRCSGTVKDAADDDGVVCSVVVAQHAARGVLTPGEDGPA